jgi:hypothetical protein
MGQSLAFLNSYGIFRAPLQRVTEFSANNCSHFHAYNRIRVGEGFAIQAIQFNAKFVTFDKIILNQTYSTLRRSKRAWQRRLRNDSSRIFPRFSLCH